MIDPGNTNAYQKFVEPATVEEYASYWKVYLEHTCLGKFVGYDGAAEEEDDHGDDHDEHEDDHHEHEGEKKWVGDLPFITSTVLGDAPMRTLLAMGRLLNS